MILYDLTCPDDHRFESWFRNSGAVEKLIKAGQVSCPVCGSKKVQKALQAPRIAKSSDDEAPRAKGENTELAAAMEKAAEAFSALQKVIEKNFDHVGDKFPEEARRIHYGEAKKRGIYGTATPKETEALREEGIEVHAVPWTKRSNAN